MVLERKRFRRCDSPFLQKQYRGRPGEGYEQRFWLTQPAMQRHRPSFRLATRQTEVKLVVRVDSNEKNPWRFPGVVVERGPISCGDCALMPGEEYLAIIERKTMDDVLADFGVMPALHRRLTELAARPCHALVIEASYADCLNLRKLYHYIPCLRAMAIAALHALHPGPLIVYGENRRAANEWTRHFFTAVWQTGGRPKTGRRGAHASRLRLKAGIATDREVSRRPKWMVASSHRHWL